MTSAGAEGPRRPNGWWMVVPKSRWGWLLIWVLWPAGSGFAQELIVGTGGAVHLVPSDAAILESAENRKDLPCTVTPDKPVLGYDFKFHVAYEATVQLKELIGSDNQLTMVFRVTPENHPENAAYFSQHFQVPQVDSDEGGPAYLDGSFEIGEGKYHVDWLMRDRAERMCSFHWDSEASLPPKDKPMTLDITAGAIQAIDPEMFKQEPPVEREQKEPPLNVKVMLNYAPQDADSAKHPAARYPRIALHAAQHLAGAAHHPVHAGRL